MRRNGESQLIVALDVNSIETAGYFVRRMFPYANYFKVGLEMMTAVGTPKAINYLESYGARNIFLDAKIHDIPNTTGKTVKAAANLGVTMISVHSSSDNCDSLKAAVDNKGNTLVLAVIRLTSSEDELEGKSRDVFLDRIYQSKKAGVDGMICSAKHLELVNQFEEFKGLLRVTPGIRPEWALKDDHKKFSAPAQAVENGADFLVIGRPIISPPKEIGHSEKAIELIIKEMKSVYSKEAK